MAKVTSVTVNAGRTFNHPYESYSNLRPSVTVTATLDEGEDFLEVTKQLQAQAEGLVEDHKNHMLNSLRELNDLTEKQAKMRRLSASIQSAQRELDEIRNGTPGLASIEADDTIDVEMHDDDDDDEEMEF